MRLHLSVLPICLLLVTVLVYGSSEMVHSRLLQIGEGLWPGYFAMRIDPVLPTCDPSAAPAKAPKAADLDGEDELDDLLGEEQAAPAEAVALAAQALVRECRDQHEKYNAARSQITSGVRAYRAFETGIAELVNTGVSYLQHLLVLIVLLCAVSCTWRRNHIALRSPHTRLEHRVSSLGQLVGHLLLGSSVIALWRIERETGIVGHEALSYFWMAGFAILSGINLYHLVKLPEDAAPGRSLVRASMTVPLFSAMAMISGTYFLLAEGHAAGLAIYISKLADHSILYLHVGLYVFIGMLLKQTRLAELVVDLVRPWKLNSELLAFVLVAGAALPTAYSGASGIFVIATGAVVYKELVSVGARQQLALAATAMSGSLGVVLSPCLLVVIVASLNKQVTTDELYGWGVKVFFLTAFLFLVGSLLVRRGPMTIAPFGEAFPATLRALRPLAPYVLIAGSVLAAYGFGLDIVVDEHSAPAILPILLLLLLLYDRGGWRSKRSAAETGTSETVARPGFARSVLGATHETSGHIGALLMLMGLSICLGGIVERAELMSLVPQSFGSTFATMGALAVALILIGMTMDPYGAVILVSASIADVAYRNGIDPVHFWMVVLVAFELGYLTPPVALNHLLTRQVVGDKIVDEAESDVEGSFWHRHERIMLPMTVMGAAMLIVAFVPLWFY